jgi:hypothetical protein
MAMDARLKAELVGASLVLPALIATFSAGYPTAYCPFPALTTLPAFFLPIPPLYYAVALIPGILFFLWNWSLLRGQSNVPRRTVAAATALGVLTAVWFAGSWEYGLEFQGARYTIRMLAITLAAPVYTTDKDWKNLRLGIPIHVLR